MSRQLKRSGAERKPWRSSICSAASPQDRRIFFRARLDYNGTTTRGVVQSFFIGNHAPVALADNVFVPNGGIGTVIATANDSDPDGDTLTITDVSSATFGSVAVLPDGRGVQYVQAIAATDYDSFTYTVSDGFGGTDTTVVNVILGSARPVEPRTQILATTGASRFTLADGTVTGANFVATGFGTPAIGDNRDIVALMRYRAGRVPGSAIYKQDGSGAETLLALTGAPAHGIVGATYTMLRDPLISPAGYIAFLARYRTATTTSANDESVWVNWDGAFRPMLSEGYPLLGALP
jgi:hypothetical protein